MLRKLLFLIIVLVAFQRLSASVHFSATISICHKEIQVNFQNATINQSLSKLPEVYWEEDDNDRLNWDKKSEKFESGFNKSFLIAIHSKELLYSRNQLLFSKKSTPIYLSNGNLRI